jgi:hypothetical protein
VNAPGKRANDRDEHVARAPSSGGASAAASFKGIGTSPVQAAREAAAAARASSRAVAVRMRIRLWYTGPRPEVPSRSKSS